MPLRLGNFQPQRGSWSTTFAEPTRIVDRSFFQGADEDAETFGQQGGLIIDSRDLFRLRKTVAAGTIRGAVRAMLTSSNGRFEPPQEFSEQPLHQSALKSVQCRLVEIRTVAGRSNARQCVLSGGPYTVSSHVRHCCARLRAQSKPPDPLGRRRVEGVSIRASRRRVRGPLPARGLHHSPSTLTSLCAGAVAGNRTGSRVLVALTWARQTIPLTQFTA
jgi:hypothetical protein